jgi:hypothetical protein
MLLSQKYDLKLNEGNKRVYILRTNHIGCTSQLNVYLGMYLNQKNKYRSTIRNGSFCSNFTMLQCYINAIAAI